MRDSPQKARLSGPRLAVSITDGGSVLDRECEKVQFSVLIGGAPGNSPSPAAMSRSDYETDNNMSTHKANHGLLSVRYRFYIVPEPIHTTNILHRNHHPQFPEKTR